MAAAIETAMWMALKARVQSLSLTPPVAIVWPKANAPTSGKYIKVDLLPNRTERFAVTSSAPHLRPGILQLTLSSPLTPPDAVEVDMNIAAQIAAHFPTDLRMPYADIWVRITKAPDVAMGYRDDDTARWLTPVSISFEAIA